mmetsp:Transcript_9385/g.19475  ORF Transcript_9385/g.19475 Transcript_9385/m.19475 type:complete len:238 (-) Transcript_9385:787-1500(-)
MNRPQILGTFRKTSGQVEKTGKLWGRCGKGIYRLAYRSWEFAFVGSGQTHHRLVDAVCLVNGADTDGSVGAHWVVVLFVVFSDSLQGHASVRSGRAKVALGFLEQFPGDGELLRFLEGIHPARKFQRVIARQKEEVSFKVARHTNVHGWRNCFLNILAMVLPFGEESVKNVVFVGCYNESANRKANLFGIEPSQNISKVSGRNGEANLFALVGFLIRYSKVTPEIIRNLGQDTAPVD